MSTSSTFHPERRKIADSPSFRRVGPENKCKHRGPQAPEPLAGGSGGATASVAAGEPGEGTGGKGSEADLGHFPFPLPLPFFAAFFAAPLA
eukprot:9762427-Alexandrium_andersonii.AAC.1